MKKHYGIEVEGSGGQQPSGGAQPNFNKKSSCLDAIENLKVQREERRARMEDVKRKRTERENNNQAMGIKVDVEF